MSGEVFAVFDRQDSGCVSYGVRSDDHRWFVKTATDDRAAAALSRALVLHGAVGHPAIVAPVASHRDAAGRPVLIYPWVEGRVLYHSTLDPGVPRRDPRSVWSRFRRLPVAEIEGVVAELLDAHRAVTAAGFIAGDLYDGCLLYEFGGDDTTGRLHLIDLDEYRPGPWVADEPPCGSARFMAPEEVLGGTLDERTTVYNLGRAIRLLLDAGDDERAWRGRPAQLAVLTRATAPYPADRYADVAALTAAWSTATPSTAARSTAVGTVGADR